MRGGRLDGYFGEQGLPVGIQECFEIFHCRKNRVLANERSGLFYEHPPAMSRSPKSKWHDGQRQVNEAGECIRDV